MGRRTVEYEERLEKDRSNLRARKWKRLRREEEREIRRGKNRGKAFTGKRVYQSGMGKEKERRKEKIKKRDIKVQMQERFKKVQISK